MKTSAVIPTKNNISTIRQCLSSLMPYYQQGYISEIVVVDAHSTDGTLEIVKHFPVKLLSCDVLTHDFTYFAREIGWRSATGELILFIDSDAYVGESFFPTICGFFNDKGTGIVGAQEKAVGTNQVTRAIGEWWIYQADKLRGLISQEPSSWSFFQRLYQRAAWGGEKYTTTAGPCYVVRRTCLEAVNGFECPEGSADMLLSRRIIERGWKAAWWVDAPLYHHPPSSVKHLVKQRIFFGRLDAKIHQKSMKVHQKLILIISRLGTPVVGLGLAIRFKNPRHLYLFPLAHYAWLSGYLGAWLLHRKS